jgi:hypothetical protein
MGDQSRRLIAFLMMDVARHCSIIITRREAITAASQRLPTAPVTSPPISIRKTEHIGKIAHAHRHGQRVLFGSVAGRPPAGRRASNTRK